MSKNCSTIFCCNHTLCSNFFRTTNGLMRTLRVRGDLKLNRTLVSFRHRLASLGNPKEKCSLLFGFARDRFFLKMERTFFFLGFCPRSFWAVWRGFNSDSVLPKLFSGEKDLAKPRLISRPQKGVWGMNAGGILNLIF